MLTFLIVFLLVGILRDKLMKEKLFLGVVFIFFFVNKLWCNDIDIWGSLKTEIGVVSVLNNDYYYLGKECLRINFSTSRESEGKIEGSFDFSLIKGQYLGFVNFNTNSIYLGDDTFLIFDVRKLILSVDFGIMDVIIGRQFMNFGYGIGFSPIEFFDRVDIMDVNFSKIGVDGVRLKFPFSDTGNIDFVFIPKVLITNSQVAFRSVGSLFGFEFGGVVGYFGDEGYIRGGFAFKGDLEVGLYAEISYNLQLPREKEYFEFMFGCDYSFYDKILLRLEYYYNSFEESYHNLQYFRRYPFLSKDYVFLQVSYVLDMFNKFNLSYIRNLEKGSWMVFLGFWNELAQNVGLGLDFRFIHSDISGLSISENRILYISLVLEVKF